MSDRVKVFFVEPTGKVQLRYKLKNAEAIESALFANDEAARAASSGLDCEWCGYIPIYRAPDGREFTISDAPAGAMWDCTWMHEHFPKGPDGMILCVRLPNGHDWNIDSRASNCTKPDDKVHRCWCRHGDPKSGNVHVDKSGETCAAGAGSIMAGDYHGFLHNGFLVRC